jgi:two-component system KDP operon response regulator KdpE
MSHGFRSGRLLVVDDERSVRSSLQEILEQEGHRVATAASGEEALALLAKEHFDLLLVDFKMEGMDGMELMAEAKRLTPDAVVIMLTAFGTLDSAIGALRHGAHDYLLKPCSVQEIVASVETGLAKRWQALQRREIVSSIEQGVRQLTASSSFREPRAEGPTPSRFIRTRHLILDRAKQIVVANGEPLSLTPTEFRLLACLMANMNRTLSFRELAQEALEYECSDKEARSVLKTHLWRLRKKLRAETGHDSHIVNVRGKGYMFTP